MGFSTQTILNEDSSSRQIYLYVEGANNDSIDAVVLNGLFEGLNITVRNLGSSSNVKGAVSMFTNHEPNSFFLVDRDHHLEDIQECYQLKREGNLFVWSKKELENYFIAPDFLSHSSFFCGESDKLKDLIIDTCQKELYLDIVNLIIAHFTKCIRSPYLKS